MIDQVRPQAVRQPMQPVITDPHGVLRFHGNAIVRHLLDHGGIDLNQLACIDFPQEDREQFAQLIGYSLSGFGELSYVRNTTYEAAAAMADLELSELEARLKVATDTLEELRAKMREIVPLMFHIHPDDLTE